VLSRRSTVLLEVRYEVVDEHRPRADHPDGEPVDEIIFHPVSER
jgi:hypothetical protein